MNINGAFRFHNVGQGLFYSGILNKKDKNRHDVFSFVYDCGTESAISFLQREIDDHKLLLSTRGGAKRKKLSLLVISHLHDDHVNGLEYLLKDTEVDTVVMPYINDDLKLLARLESHSNGGFLQVFYADPIAWFLSKGVRRILLIGSEEIAEGKNDSLDDQRPYFENADIYIEQQSILKIDHSGETDIVYLKNKTQVSYRNFCWEFYFENLRLKLSDVQSYIHTVRKFGQIRGLTLEQVFKDKSLLKDLRQEVKKVFPSGYILNRTSVVLLHKPTVHTWTLLCCLHHCKHLIHCTRYLHLREHDTILTGDVELNDNEKLEMIDQDDVHLLVQYPHHGSGKNNIQYFIDLGAKVNVLSYGITNRYGHPHDKVLLCLPYIAFVNEREDFSYQIMTKDF